MPLSILPGDVCLRTHMHAHMCVRTHTHRHPGGKEILLKQCNMGCHCAPWTQDPLRQVLVESYGVGQHGFEPTSSICTWLGHSTILSLHSPYVKGMSDIDSVGCCRNSENYCKMWNIIGAGEQHLLLGLGRESHITAKVLKKIPWSHIPLSAVEAKWLEKVAGSSSVRP